MRSEHFDSFEDPEVTGHGHHERLHEFKLHLRSQQNLAGGTIAGVFGAVIGAGLWATVAAATQFKVGFMAVVVGLIVGVFVRVVGKGVDPIFGVVGMTLAVLACVAGNLLAICGLIALRDQVPFFDVVGELGPRLAWDWLSRNFRPMDGLFYTFAAYVAFRLSVHRISQQELTEFNRMRMSDND